MLVDWHIQRNRGFLDALIDIGRDLQDCEIDHTALTNNIGRREIIRCVEKRIGKPSDAHKETRPEGYNTYFEAHRGERWLEGRLTGYTSTLRSLCYIDCGAGSARALIQISNMFESEYGVENTIADGGMEALVDQIHDTIGSPPEASEGYDWGYVNMLRLIEHLSCLNGF